MKNIWIVVLFVFLDLTGCGLAPQSELPSKPVLPQDLYGQWKMDLGSHRIEEHPLPVTRQKNDVYPKGSTLILVLKPNHTFESIRIEDTNTTIYKNPKSHWKIALDTITKLPTLLLYAPPKYMPGAYERPLDSSKSDISFLEIRASSSEKNLLLCNGDGDDYACFYPIR